MHDSDNIDIMTKIKGLRAIITMYPELCEQAAIEIKNEVEVGSDLRFFNNKVSLSATYYSNKTKDVILSVQVPSSTGYDNKLANIGTIENKGF